MGKQDMEQQVIENYQNDEKMMILIFAQWCINHDLDPKEMYKRAYPAQGENHALSEALALTVPEAESAEIPDQTVLQILQLFGNDDLAFIVQQVIDKRVG
ncbi:hypothetical protein [Lentibacillus populi]|uniref:hypothetical protein n=1 Tax=Lentibacillus populi TaxID=1827502 RepID=UPI0016631520|nr:hypothetical protein [Lentibacillus populi]